MDPTIAAERYLAELKQITGGMAAGHHLEDVLQAITRGLRRSGRLTSVSVTLMLRDAECPRCEVRPPRVPSADVRLHRVAFDAEGEREAPDVFHVTAVGRLFSGRVALDRRVLLVEDVLAQLRAGGGSENITGEDAARLVGQQGIVSGAFLPLLCGDELVGVLSAYSPDRILPEEAAYFEVFALQAATMIRNARLYDEVEALKERLSRENAYLDLAVREEGGFSGIVGRSDAMQRVLAVVRQVAPTDATVLLTGETGAGKELIARAIHDGSARAARPMIKVNCGAIPTGLVESEFFGHERGAFTGALQRRIGRFELADRGSIFLDEVGELAPETQVGLLRVLQEREFQRVGGERTIRVDVRVLAATNRELHSDVGSGRFRADLFYRLNVLHIRIPPLRQRREDIPALASHFATQFSRRMGKPFAGLSAAGLDALMAYDWPGNIRELQNVMERACVLSHGPMIEITDPGETTRVPGVQAAAEQPLEWTAMERQHLLRVLERVGWRIEGPGGAASLVGVKPSTLRSRMKKLGISRPLLA